MTVNERIKILVDTLTKGNIRTFAKTIGVTPTTITNIFNRGGAPSFKVISGILEAYPKVDANWLITGTGGIWKDSGPSKENIVEEPQIGYGKGAEVVLLKMDLKSKEQHIRFLKQQIEDKDYIIELLKGHK